MGKYVTVAEANNYLGLSCDDSTMSALIDGAESMVDNYVGADLSENATWSEEHSYPANTWQMSLKYGREIYLDGINPHGTLKIDSATISTSDYRFFGQKLVLKNAVTLNQTFPYMNKYEFTSGFATIPNDVKQACFIIVGELHTTKTAGGISSFRQDMLSVNYSKDNSMLVNILSPDKMNSLALLLNKYKAMTLLGSGIDRLTIP